MGDDAIDYDEVRRVASKNWLSSAGVSLAKLDEVKAQIYNVDLANHKAIKVANKTSILQKEPHPPLSNVTQQNNAWGSSSSIPELIKKQSERQKALSRPTSAKMSLYSRTRPPSGRKPRPSSAKASAHCPSPNPGDENGVKVQGNNYSGGVESLPGATSEAWGLGDPHGGTIKYDDDFCTLGKASRAKLDDFCIDECANAQTNGVDQQWGLSAPRSSPDLRQISLDQLYLGCGDQVAPPPSSMDRPKSSVHVTMDIPCMTLDDEDDDDDEDQDTERLLRVASDLGSAEVTQKPTSFTPSYLDPNDTNPEHQTPLKLNVDLAQLPTKDDPDNTIDVNAAVTDILASGVLGTNSNDKQKISSRIEQILGGGGGKKKLGVVIAEDRNKTMDITPRNRGHRSGPVTMATASAARRRSTSPKSRDHSAEASAVRRGVSDVLRQSAVSTVSVAYIMDDGVEESPSSTDLASDSTKRKIKTRKPPKEVETMVSRIAMSEKENDSDDGEISEVLATDTFHGTKVTSQPVKNYYEQALHQKETTGEAAPALTKTVKTLAFVEGAQLLAETKCLSVLDPAPAPPRDVYKAPRPASASRTRPASAKAAGDAITNKKSQLSVAKTIPDTTKDTQNQQSSAKTISCTSKDNRNEQSTTKSISESATTDNKIQPSSSKSISDSPNTGSNCRPPLGRHASDTPDNAISDPVLPANDTTQPPPPQSGCKSRLGEAPNSAASSLVISRPPSARRWAAAATPGMRGTTSSKPPIPRSTPAPAKIEHSRPRPSYLSTRSASTSALLPRHNDDIRTCVQQDDPEPRPGSRLGNHPEPAFDKWDSTENDAISKRVRISSASAIDTSSALERLLPPPHHTRCSHLHTLSASTFAEMEKKKQKERKKYDHNQTHTQVKPRNYLDRPGATKKAAPAYTDDVVEIWTRKEDFTYETEGLKECKEIQSKLIDNGVPVALETLKRALLPPTEYGWTGPSYKSTSSPSLPSSSSNGLLSRPETWLPEEAKRVAQCRRLVRQAEESLAEQAREERRQAAMQAIGGNGRPAGDARGGSKKKGRTGSAGKKRKARPKSSK